MVKEMIRYCENDPAEAAAHIVLYLAKFKTNEPLIEKIKSFVNRAAECIDAGIILNRAFITGVSILKDHVGDKNNANSPEVFEWADGIASIQMSGGIREAIDIACEIETGKILPPKKIHHPLSKDMKDAPGTSQLDPKDCNSHFFAPKLAAAIEVWEALTQDPKSIDENAVAKKATAWLIQNAERLGLMWKDSKTGETKPNTTAIKEIAKVVNWNPDGGASKTPE